MELGATDLFCCTASSGSAPQRTAANANELKLMSAAVVMLNPIATQDRNVWVCGQIIRFSLAAEFCHLAVIILPSNSNRDAVHNHVGSSDGRSKNSCLLAIEQAAHSRPIRAYQSGTPSRRPVPRPDKGPRSKRRYPILESAETCPKDPIDCRCAGPVHCGKLPWIVAAHEDRSPK